MKDRIAIDKTSRGERAVAELKERASIARLMQPRGKQDQTLTCNTAEALEWTSNRLVVMSENLQDATTEPLKHKFVCLGFYQQDFSRFPHSASCNYYIIVQEVMATHAIDKTRIMLQLEERPDNVDSRDIHKCDLCNKNLLDTDLLLLDSLAEGEMMSDVTTDEEMAIYFMAGYVASKHKELSCSNPTDHLEA